MSQILMNDKRPIRQKGGLTIKTYFRKLVRQKSGIRSKLTYVSKPNNNICEGLQKMQMKNYVSTLIFRDVCRSISDGFLNWHGFWRQLRNNKEQIRQHGNRQSNVLCNNFDVKINAENLARSWMRPVLFLMFEFTKIMF